MKKIQRNQEDEFKTIYLSDGLADSAHFKLGVPHPKGVPQQTIVYFQSGTIELWMHENSIFLVPVKYTLVCCVPTLAVLGCTTHYLVS